jgi:hypothetical protein
LRKTHAVLDRLPIGGKLVALFVYKKKGLPYFMKQVFVLQNQFKQLLTKSGEWSDGRDANSLYRTEHKDEAINQQFEVSSKDYTLRISLLECALNDRRNPVIPEEHLPAPMAMPEAEEAGSDETPEALTSDVAVEQTETATQEQVPTEIHIDATEFEAVARDLFAANDAAADTAEAPVAVAQEAAEESVPMDESDKQLF